MSCLRDLWSGGIIQSRAQYTISASMLLTESLCMMSLVLALLLESSASAPHREDQVLIMGLAAGSQTVETATDAATRAEFSYNDRGRGDHIIAIWKLDAAGVPTQYSGSGNDYMKAPIEETFLILGNEASWKNRAEEGVRAVRGEAFYMPS
jgi:hypothetical protein